MRFRNPAASDADRRQDSPLRAPVLKAALVGMVSTPAGFGFASASPILGYASSQLSPLRRDLPDQKLKLWTPK